MSPRALSKLAAVFFLALAGEAAAQSRAFSVNTTDDTADAVPGDGACADAGGNCSLRAAIMEANVGVSASGDTIGVPAGLYRITLGPLEVTATMTINGATTGRTIIEGATAGTGVFELGSVLYTQKVFQGTDTVTGVRVPRAVATTSSADFVPDATFLNCLQAEGCLGKAGLVDAGGVPAGTPIHPVSFDFSVSPAERAAVAGFRGLGILRVEGARDLGHKLGVAKADVVESTLDGSGVGTLFQDTIDSCPAGETTAVDLECGPNFHTDKIGLSSQTIPDTSFQAAAGDGSMQVVLSPVSYTTTSDVGRFKVFSVQLLYLKQVFVTLRSLTVQGAANSAFLNNGATLKGLDLVVRNSSAPVGAGFWNQSGSLILQDSTIEGNDAVFGGGMFNAPLGLVDLDRCTVSNNKADLFTGGSGGGILNGGTLYLYNSTVSGNLARLGGGGIHNTGQVVANFSTITDNSANLDLSKNFAKEAVGGGIANVGGGHVDLANSILAGNRDGRDSGLPFPADLVSPDCYDVAVPSAPPLRNFLSARDNVVGILNAACDLRDAVATVSGLPFDRAGSASAPLAAGLGPLADNGGFTRTHALEPGSPAIDADDDANPSYPCLRNDQRGIRRPGDEPGDTTCDAGAYEAGGRTVLPQDPSTGSSPVSVTFSTINQPGVTRLNVRSSGPPPPSGFTLGNPPLYFELSTTATFSPPLIVCIDYSGTSFQNDTTLRLYHYENVNGTLLPIDRTLSLDTVKKVICASVDSFSLFAPFERVNRPPHADAGADQRLECEGGQGAHATLDGSASSDPDGDSLRFEWRDAAGAVVGSSSTVSLVLPLGGHPFRLEVTDARGLEASDSVEIAVGDTSAPVITRIAAVPAVLWPANNKMVPVTVDVSVADRCDSAASCRIVSVRSDERCSGHDPDWQIVGDLTLKLRAERSRHGRGRTYTIAVECLDASRNRASQTVTVRVPHDRR